jgi:hypothetical protein
VLLYSYLFKASENGKKFDKLAMPAMLCYLKCHISTPAFRAIKRLVYIETPVAVTTTPAS